MSDVQLTYVLLIGVWGPLAFYMGMRHERAMRSKKV